MLRIFKCISLTLFAFIIIACAKQSKPETTGQYLDSTTITAKVKASLIDKLGAEGFAINVKTYKDEVQLSGFVNNASVKVKAGEIAKKTANVQSVRNDLIIK
ncbi:putative periplasmic or secreted lipoprotein (plasmid) [Legionella adelaidensis]|uniref:Putative periplasmic or secreted lipoprotein n=1 Tax=Legionella adelaidensis TaxID=45056 RepID=A0A0W0R575_9GAMM|nr:BON domain-containing protein [Legionella adelaidensis]KTC66181.1 putative periplasmic or secreted lipoprotein [Legionella adelaidensis]VEH85576.1 putative periplasmic or secreted lipoprotein [Legionella adelaidensis]